MLNVVGKVYGTKARRQEAPFGREAALNVAGELQANKCYFVYPVKSVKESRGMPSREMGS